MKGRHRRFCADVWCKKKLFEPRPPGSMPYCGLCCGKHGQNPYIPGVKYDPKLQKQVNKVLDSAPKQPVKAPLSPVKPEKVSQDLLTKTKPAKEKEIYSKEYAAKIAKIGVIWPQD